MKKLLIILTILSFLVANDKTKAMESANFNENTSTAFALLGVAPATINNFGSAKEIKLDWFYKDGKLMDNIAIECKPFWYGFFRKVDYKKYRNLRYIVKKLGDTSVSAGLKTVDTTNRYMAVAVNLNLYKKADPLTDTNLLAQVNTVYSDREKEVLKKSTILEMQYEMEGDPKKKATLKKEINFLNAELEKLTTQEEARVAKIIEEYRIINWNKSFINLGYGFTMNFSFINETKDFKYIKGNGNNIIWLHSGFPIKKAILVSLLNRYSFNNKIFCNGFNFRVKLNKLNTFFLEFVSYNSIISKTGHSYEISFGGNFKIKKLHFGLGFKTDFNYQFEFQKITPKYQISFRI